MFGILIIDLLFFAIPILLLSFLGISIYRYISAKRQNAKAPDTFSSNELKTRKLLLIISAVLTAVFVTIVVGFVALLFLAVAYM